MLQMRVFLPFFLKKFFSPLKRQISLNLLQNDLFDAYFINLIWLLFTEIAILARLI